MIRPTISTIAAVPHVVAQGIHAVAPRIRSRYTVHAVAISIMATGFRVTHSEHAAVEWIGLHLGSILHAVAEIGWEPLGELLKAVGIAPYLEFGINKALKPLEPSEEKK